MAAVKAAEATGLKNADDYYPEITEDEVKQMQEMAKALETDKVKADASIMQKQIDARAKVAIAQMDNQLFLLEKCTETKMV